MENKKLLMSNFNQFIEIVSHWKNNYMDFGDGITLYRGEIHIIVCIGNYPGIFISEIARNIGVTRAVISKSIKKLENDGYVIKTIDPRDRKRVTLHLSEKGRKAYQAHERFMLENDGYMYEYLDRLDDKELEAINRFIVNAKKMILNHY